MELIRKALLLSLLGGALAVTATGCDDDKKKDGDDPDAQVTDDADVTSDADVSSDAEVTGDASES